MVGRKLDQGILVKLVIEDTEIRAIHRVKLARTGASACNDAQGCCPLASASPRDGDVAIEVPELGSQEVLGEWLIPHGELLLVSFGAHTVANPAGKATVKERLAIIGAEEVSLASTIHAASSSSSAQPALDATRALPPTSFLPALDSQGSDARPRTPKPNDASGVPCRRNSGPIASTAG
jgi:hypothetical protein